jgi:hypothetical protein
MSTTYSAKIQNYNTTKPNHKLVTTTNYLENGYSLIKRNPLTKKLDKLNYIIKNNKDVVYRGEKFYDVDLTGFNYDILYSGS